MTLLLFVIVVLTVAWVIEVITRNVDWDLDRVSQLWAEEIEQMMEEPGDDVIG